MPKLNTDKKHVSGPRLRVVIEPDVAIGPGKADLLEAIRDTGSISAAGRKLGMSYRRAWLLVDDAHGFGAGVGAQGGAADQKFDIRRRQRYGHSAACSLLRQSASMACVQRRRLNPRRRGLTGAGRREGAGGASAAPGARLGLDDRQRGARGAYSSSP